MSVTLNAIGSFNGYHKDKCNKKVKVATNPYFITHMSIGLFDGASQDDGARCGVSMRLTFNYSYFFKSFKWIVAREQLPKENF